MAPRKPTIATQLQALLPELEAEVETAREANIQAIAERERTETYYSDVCYALKYVKRILRDPTDC